MKSNEISNEVKAKVFAMYLYQLMIAEGSEMELTGTNHMDGEPYLIGYNGHNGDGDFHPDDCKLILRQLNQLTNEEKDELANILGVLRVDNFIQNFRHKSSYSINIHETIAAFQYLLSIGIDLPSIHLDGKTLIEAGLAIRKEETNGSK